MTIYKRLSDWEDQVRVRGSLGSSWNVACYEEVPTTMDAAAALASSHRVGEDGSLVVLTQRQPSGRGREGRSWIATDGAMLATWGIQYKSDLEHLIGLSLAIGCQIHKALADLGIDIALKWPNDLMRKGATGWQKTGGILIEVQQYSGVRWILIGVGLNLRRPPAEVEASGALGELSLEAPAVAGMLSEPLRETIGDFEACKSGFAKYRDYWQSISAHRSGTIIIRSGEERLKGEYAGVSKRGGLLITIGRETREVLSGHVEEWT